MIWSAFFSLFKTRIAKLSARCIKLFQNQKKKRKSAKKFIPFNDSSFKITEQPNCTDWIFQIHIFIKCKEKAKKVKSCGCSFDENYIIVSSNAIY